MRLGDENVREKAQRIGPYEIRKWLGEGGMGEVCRAYDTRLDREVAIKRILVEKTSSPTVRQRFLREARSAARLNHPSIVQVYDLMTEGQTDWIVMGRRGTRSREGRPPSPGPSRRVPRTSTSATSTAPTNTAPRP